MKNKIRDLNIINKKNVYKGFNKINRFKFKYKLFSKKWSNVLDREIYTPRNAIALLPYDKINNEVLLIKQFRLGAYLAGFNPIQIEIIAGNIDKNDHSPKTSVKREAEEESGLKIKIKKLRLINKILNSPGTSCEKTYIYFYECDLSNSGGIYGCKRENEEIKTFKCSLNKAMKMITHGKINSVHSLIALNWLNEYVKND